MHPMLRPQDTATRERKALDGLWKFRLDVDGVGRAERWYAGPLADAQDMAVPASYNDLVGEAREHVGEVWYQRTVRLPRGWADQRIVLYFESATHRATVWVDEEEVARHEGGYTPFEADITAVAPAGAPVRITVCVDNTLSFQSIPPGVVEQTPAGPRQRYWHDFYNYAGLHRTVWLACTPAARVEDVTVVTGLDGTTGTVEYRVDAVGALDAQVVLRDADGVPVGTGTGLAGVVTVPDVHPWAPGDGYLYDLEVQLVDPDGAVVDSYHQSVGVRTVEVRGTAFLINGEPFRFTGFGMHEDHPTLGKGHNDAFLVQDFALLDWIGANSFRTSHYPYSEDVLDLADRRGIVVIDETAAVGMNMGLGAASWARRATRPSATTRSTTRPRRCTRRRSASSSRGTRTTRASCCGRSPTSPSRRPRRPRTTSARSSTSLARPTRPDPWGSST
jgi:beta-glucuronidase